MRHIYECPMRWADLDLLGHVNNVTYLNYLREARIDFFATLGRSVDVDDLAEGIRITRNQVIFATPLLFRSRPITVELWTSDVGDDSFVLNYEIVDNTGEGRVVYARVRAELQPWITETGQSRSLTEDERAKLDAFREDPIEFRPVASPDDVAVLPSEYQLTIRLSDLDIYRRVSDAIYFEYFQEGRVNYLSELASRAEQATALVLARTDVTYHRPVRLRREPYLVRSGVASVGNSSFAVTSQILDGEIPMASASVVLVGFDPVRQAASPLSFAQREALLAENAIVTGL